MNGIGSLHSITSSVLLVTLLLCETQRAQVGIIPPMLLKNNSWERKKGSVVADPRLVHTYSEMLL